MNSDVLHWEFRVLAAGQAGSRGTISRQQIIDTALRAVRTKGYEQLTIRSLAADLGVSHVAVGTPRRSLAAGGMRDGRIGRS